MPDAAYFAEKAECCRALMRRASVPEIADQLRLWADEFDAMAAAIDSGEAIAHIRRRHLATD